MRLRWDRLENLKSLAAVRAAAEAMSRETLLEMLQWNDRNSSWTDKEADLDEIKHATKLEAVDAVVNIVKDAIWSHNDPRRAILNNPGGARFPKGISAAVKKYASRIQDAVGIKVHWDKVLGCGSFGCVFPTENPGQVLKISSDPTEGPVVRAVMDTKLDKQLDGLGRWYGVWKIPEPINASGPRSTGWVILREDIKPFAREGWTWPVWGNYLVEYNRHSRKSIDLKTKWKAERQWEDAQEFIGKMYNFEETYFIAEALEALNRVDIRLADIHAGNLGFRIHPTEDQPTHEVYWYDKKDRPPLLIFDLGHSSAPKTTAAVQDLWKLEVRQNPWIPEAAREIEEV